MSRLNVNQIYTRDGTGSPAIREMPAFRAYLSADQSVTSGVPTKLNIDTKTGDGFFDTNDWFDTTNNRYVPQIAGYYNFNFQLRVDSTNPNTFDVAVIYPYKNGSQYSSQVINRSTFDAPVGGFMSTLIYLNGSTDYVEFWGQINGTSIFFDFNITVATCVFEGFLVRPD